jgi:hypothetical protein
MIVSLNKVWRQKKLPGKYGASFKIEQMQIEMRDDITDVNRNINMKNMFMKSQFDDDDLVEKTSNMSISKNTTKATIQDKEEKAEADDADADEDDAETVSDKMKSSKVTKKVEVSKDEDDEDDKNEDDDEEEDEIKPTKKSAAKAKPIRKKASVSTV